MSSIYTLLGDPVEHSVSPALYGAAFDSLGVDARYECRHVSAADFPDVVRETAGRGGGNVTLPHKMRAAAVLEAPSPAVLRSGACNCFWLDRQGVLAGDNTDVAGFLAAAAMLAEATGVRLDGARCLVLGAGGAARAVLIGLAEAHASQVDVLNRKRERAARMLGEVRASGPPFRLLRRLSEASPSYDLVINATSLGLRPDDPLPVDLTELKSRAVLDCVYGPGGTDWTRHAETRRIPAMDGTEMLVAQARQCVRNWLETDVDPEPLRRAALAALASSNAASRSGAPLA